MATWIEGEEYLSTEYIKENSLQKFKEFQISLTFVSLEETLKRLCEINGILERQDNSYRYNIDLFRDYYLVDVPLDRRLSETSKKIKQNPYIKKEKFYGRELEIKDIFDQMNRKRNILITGPSKIGKSFLISNIYNFLSKEIQGNNYVFLPMYLDGISSLTESEFFVKLSEELKKEIGDDDIPSEGLNSRTLRSLLSKLKETERHLILLIDPFDPIIKGDSEDSRFLSYLRAIDGLGLSYIITSSKSQRELLDTLNEIGSSFINIFVEVPLMPFISGEARQLTTASKGIVNMSEADIRFVLELVEIFPPPRRYPENIFHPSCIQVACSYLFEYKVAIKENLDNKDYKTIREVYLRDSDISNIPDLAVRDKGREYA